MPETDGYFLLAAPYPEGNELITLHPQYAGSAEEAENHQFKFKGLFIRRGTAQMLSKSLSELLSAPDTEPAWESIASNPVDEACCFEDEPETI